MESKEAVSFKTNNGREITFLRNKIHQTKKYCVVTKDKDGVYGYLPTSDSPSLGDYVAILQRTRGKNKNDYTGKIKTVSQGGWGETRKLRITMRVRIAKTSSKGNASKLQICKKELAIQADKLCFTPATNTPNIYLCNHKEISCDELLEYYKNYIGISAPAPSPAPAPA